MQSRFLELFKSMAFCFAIVVPMAAAQGETLTFECEEQQFDSAGAPKENRKMTITYVGQDTGIAKLNATFGDIELPANFREADRDVDGEKVHLLGFSAFGKAEVLMPPKAAMETCIAEGSKRDGLALNPDTVTYYALQCMSKLKSDPNPISANIHVGLDIIGEDGGIVDVSRAYETPSELVGGTIELRESAIPPQCKLVSRN